MLDVSPTTEYDSTVAVGASTPFRYASCQRVGDSITASVAPPVLISLENFWGFGLSCLMVPSFPPLRAKSLLLSSSASKPRERGMKTHGIALQEIYRSRHHPLGWFSCGAPIVAHARVVPHNEHRPFPLTGTNFRRPTNHGRSCQGYGGRASTDVTLQGLIDSVRAEENNSMVSSAMIYNPAQVTTDARLSGVLFVRAVCTRGWGCPRLSRVALKNAVRRIFQRPWPRAYHDIDVRSHFAYKPPQLLKELENVQHGALVKQPDVSQAHRLRPLAGWTWLAPWWMHVVHEPAWSCRGRSRDVVGRGRIPMLSPLTGSACFSVYNVALPWRA